MNSPSGEAKSRFAAYLSQSWRPRDVDLNLRVWKELADDFELLVDVPEEPGAQPAYYINRIEELLRRSDVFLGILTHRDPKAGEFTGTDSSLRCSPYSLFEIRLAERVDIPRLILYERSTGFRPPRNLRPWEAYIPFDRGIKDRLPEQHQWAAVVQRRIGQWKSWVADHRKPMSYEQSTDAATLVPASLSDPVYQALENSLLAGGFRSLRYEPKKQGSSEVFRLLREAGLVIAEFGNRDDVDQQIYAAAHAMGLPTIRMMRSQDEKKELPWILQGYPGGYQNDIVHWSKPEDVPRLVDPRIQAMFRLSPALCGADGDDYLQSKRYSQFFVFISHTLKPPNRALVEHIYSLLKKRHITPFEYHQVNTAGSDWKEALKQALKKTSHFVALLSPDYEVSETCTYELEEILTRGNSVVILPFMVGGRSVPNPKLSYMHNTLLSDPDPLAGAKEVVRQVEAALDAVLAHTEHE